MTQSRARRAPAGVLAGGLGGQALVGELDLDVVDIAWSTWRDMAFLAPRRAAAARAPAPLLSREDGVRAAHAAHGAEIYRLALRGLGDAGAAQDVEEETSPGAAGRTDGSVDVAVADDDVSTDAALVNHTWAVEVKLTATGFDDGRRYQRRRSPPADPLPRRPRDLQCRHASDHPRRPDAAGVARRVLAGQARRPAVHHGPHDRQPARTRGDRRP